MSYTIPYDLIYRRVGEVVRAREGMKNAKNPFTTRRIAAELTGYFIEICNELEVSEPEVARYFDLVLHHKFTSLPTDGKVHFVHDYVDRELYNHPLYYPMESLLMFFKPASVQVGVGEFFFCWHHAGSTFGIDNTMKFDVILDDMKLELKGNGTQKTAGAAAFDNYLKVCDGIMVVGGYQNRNNKGLLKHAQTRSWFCIAKENWRQSFTFKGDTLALVKQGAVLAGLKKRYKEAV